MEFILAMVAVMAFVIAATAQDKVSKLEKKLREQGLIDDEDRKGDPSE